MINSLNVLAGYNKLLTFKLNNNAITFTVLFILSTPVFAVDWAGSAYSDMNTVAGKLYGEKADAFVLEQIGEVMDECITDYIPPEFTLYFNIEKSGRVTGSYSTMSLKKAQCFEEKLSALVWPKPPSSHFVFSITLFNTIKGMGF